MSANLHGLIRESVGSRPARKLRAAGRIPCNIQGADAEALNFSLDEGEFLAARRRHEHLFDIEFEGRSEPETAMVRELQYDLMGDSIVHVEFKRVVRGQETEAEVELVFVGHASGGIPNHMVSSITIAAIPSQIPESIELDVARLQEGEAFTAGQLELPEGVRLVTDAATPVANLTTASAAAPEGDAEVEEAAEGEAPGGDAPAAPAE